MRIIAGEAGSRPLDVPPSVTRPTTDRVREAVFSSLGNLVPGASLLDLFAGSGSLGIEALSRGADSAVFVDNHRVAESTIQSNLASSGLDGGRIVHRNVLSYLSTVSESEFDLVFADPPYARDEQTTTLLESLLHHEGLPRALREGGIFVLESFAGAPLPESEHWKTSREKIYGQTRVSYLTATS